MKSIAQHLLSILVLVAVAAASGVLGAHWHASRQPQPPDIVVVDMARLVQPIAQNESLNDAERRRATDALGRSLREVLDAYAMQGAIVLDAQAVVSAPPDRYVAP